MPEILIDGREIRADDGANLLKTCLDHGIYIPNLCWLEDIESPHASCRLCFVEIDGFKSPIPSCTVTVQDGMTVRTDTEAVRRLQRSALRLLLSTHRIACKTCPANKHCALQQIAKFLNVGLKVKNLEHLEHAEEPSQDHPCLGWEPGRCVLCGRCVHVCRISHAQPFLSFARRGYETIIHFAEESRTEESPCLGCLKCAEVCPVGAIFSKQAFEASAAG